MRLHWAVTLRILEMSSFRVGREFIQRVAEVLTKIRVAIKQSTGNTL